MKIKIITEIEGHFSLKEPLVVNVFSCEFSIFWRQDRYYISITKPIDDYVHYIDLLLSEDDSFATQIGESPTFKNIMDWLRYIEAMGAFNFQVRKIHFNEIEMVWIGETEKENDLVAPIHSIKSFLPNNVTNKIITENTLSHLINFRRLLREEKISFGFYRQGMNFLNDHNYYFAYINFFMMLEYCFANGKFKKNDVIQEFQKADLLKLCILETLEMLKDKCINIYSWVEKEMSRRHKLVNFHDTLYLLVEYRGVLSHATHNSRAYILDDKMLHPLVVLIHSVCFSLCSYTQLYSNMSQKQKIQKIKDKIKNFENGL